MFSRGVGFASRCGFRQKSIVDTRWTHPIVQNAAHDFGVTNPPFSPSPV